MSRPYLILFLVLILGSAGFGLAQLDELKNLKQNLAALDQERTDLKKRIWDLQKRNGELENRLSHASRTATAERAQGESAGDTPSGNEALRAGPWGRGGRGEAGRFAAIMASPEVQKLMSVQQKGALDSRYSSLFKQLQLSPADLDKFKNLLVEKQSAVMDVLSTARADGLTGPANRDEVRQLVQEAQADVDNNIRSTLGDAAFAQYQGYEATAPERNVVTQLEQRLSYSTTPLTDAQSAQLVQILAQSVPPNGASSGGGGLGQIIGAFRGGPAGQVGGSTPITSDAISQAQSVLSAQQLAALQGLQQEQQASAQLRQQFRTNSSGPAAPNTASTSGGSPAPRTAGP